MKKEKEIDVDEKFEEARVLKNKKEKEIDNKFISEYNDLSKKYKRQLEPVMILRSNQTPEIIMKVASVKE